MDGVARIAERDIWARKNRKIASAIADRGSIWQEKGGEAQMNEFREGQYIIYQNGERYELGKIKRLTPSGAFVWYSNGDTAAKTPYECMHPLVNEYTIGETGLGGAMT